MKNIHPILQKKLYIFDMDGTIYLGNRVFDFAVRFINNLRASGRKVLFFTNNASHTSEFYLGKLSRLGFSPAKDEIMTSGDVTVEFLKRHRAGKSVYLVGTDELVSEFEKKGIPLVGHDAKEADIVVTSFDTSLTYQKLDTACRLVRNGAEYLSTHPDYNCPTEDGFIPDSGAIAAFVTASTGKTPKYLGKPYEETAEAICKLKGVKPEECVSIGDRLYTDIAMAKNAGMLSVLVLSGETKAEDVTEDNKPNFVLNGVKDLLGIL